MDYSLLFATAFGILTGAFLIYVCATPAEEMIPKSITEKKKPRKAVVVKSYLRYI